MQRQMPFICARYIFAAVDIGHPDWICLASITHWLLWSCVANGPPLEQKMGLAACIFCSMVMQIWLLLACFPTGKTKRTLPHRQMHCLRHQVEYKTETRHRCSMRLCKAHGRSMTDRHTWSISMAHIKAVYCVGYMTEPTSGNQEAATLFYALPANAKEWRKQIPTKQSLLAFTFGDESEN